MLGGKGGGGGSIDCFLSHTPVRWHGETSLLEAGQGKRRRKTIDYDYSRPAPKVAEGVYSTRLSYFTYHIPPIYYLERRRSIFRFQ